VGRVLGQNIVQEEEAMGLVSSTQPSSAKVIGACLKSIVAHRAVSRGNTVVKQRGNMVEVLHDDTQELAVFCGLHDGTYLLVVEGEGVPFDNTEFDLYLQAIEQILKA
jgi:hypothetical protein